MTLNQAALAATTFPVISLAEKGHGVQFDFGVGKHAEASSTTK